MLRKKKIVDKETWMKYALLALTSSVLMASSHKPKTIKEHVELIRDIDAFFAYPWRRLAFQTVLAVIKGTDPLALSQITVAVKGFFHAVHLVFVLDVPSLTEVVQLNKLSFGLESESDEDDDLTNLDTEGETNNIPGEDATENGVGKGKSIDGSPLVHCPKLSLSPFNAREIDEKAKAHVDGIIPVDD